MTLAVADFCISGLTGFLILKQLKGVGKTELAPSALFRHYSNGKPKALTFPECVNKFGAKL